MPRPAPPSTIQVLKTRSGRLSFRVSGSGRPAIVLFSGAGVALEGWCPLYPAIERLGTVFAWNRFGLPGSDLPPERQNGALVLGALRELLRHAGLHPPYLLVAHSMGGLYANLFARLHPRDTAGVLLIESTHPADHPVLKKHGPQLVRALGHLLSQPQDGFEPNVEAELAGMADMVREIEAAGAFPPVPLRVITGGLTPKDASLSAAEVGARRAHQQELARLSPRGQQVIAQNSGHFPQLSEPRLVLRVLRELADACAGAGADHAVSPL